MEHITGALIRPFRPEGLGYNTVHLSFTDELWRNNPTAQSLLFGYFIDPTGTNSTFYPAQWDSTNGITHIPSLNVSFPTSTSR